MEIFSKIKHSRMLKLIKAIFSKISEDSQIYLVLSHVEEAQTFKSNGSIATTCLLQELGHVL